MTRRQPGQLHSRDVRKTETRPTPVPSIGPILVTASDVDRPAPATLIFDPAAAGRAEPLAREIGRFWQVRHTNQRATSAAQHRAALGHLMVLLERHAVGGWDDLTISMLEEFERECGGTRSGKTRALIVWDYLRSIPMNSPNGPMNFEVRRFLKAPPNVVAGVSTPTEALPAATLRDVLRAAMYDVTQAEHRIRKAAWDGTSPPAADALIRRHETVAFFVLLCMEWSQSPDVIKTLSFDPSQPTSVQDWGDGHPRVTVRWFKHRAPGRGTVAVFLADKEWRSGSLLRRLRDATVAARSVAGGEWESYPWICADPVVGHPGKGGASLKTVQRTTTSMVYIDTADHASHMTSIFSSVRRSGFLRWCQVERKAGLSVELPEIFTRAAEPDALYFRAIRPAAKWAKFMATGKGLLLSELVDDNTIEVLSAHYLNSQVAMRDIAEAWKEIPDIAEEVARGLRPTAIDRNGSIIAGRSIDDDQAQKVVGGDLKIGISSCRDVYNSPLPGQSPGRLCGAANRSCFFCPSSVVTPDDIPAMKAYLLLAEKALITMSPPEWVLHWGRTIRWIIWILPQMDPTWESTPIGDTAVFDLGLEAGPR